MFKIKFPESKEYVEIADAVDVIYDYAGELTPENVQYESTIPEVQQLITDYADKWDYEKRDMRNLLFQFAVIDSYYKKFKDGDEAIKPLLDNHIAMVTGE